jgi:hypothetical protein
MGTAADNALNNALMRLMAQDPLPPMPQEAMPRSMVLAPPGGVMDLPTIPDDPRIKAIQDAQAQAKQDFANIRNGAAGPAPAMSAVTGNRTLLANDERSSQLGQLKDTLTGMNPRHSAPEPIMPSRAAQTGAYGASAYQSDRNARLAILNEQERNRQPVPALPEHTINLDKLPEALRQVYAQRAANDAKREAMVVGSGLKPVARSKDEKAARASEYEAAGLAVPAVFAPIASPEKVRADKQRRAEEEAYRQGNWSMQEQARAMSRKLGINPLIATAMVSDRMQQGAPVTGDGEPRMPASWEPRLREGANDGLTGDIMQSALLGPQGASEVQKAKQYTEAQRYQSDQANVRQQGANDTNLRIAQLKIDADSARALGDHQRAIELEKLRFQLAQDQSRFNQQLNPPVPQHLMMEAKGIEEDNANIANLPEPMRMQAQASIVARRKQLAEKIRQSQMPPSGATSQQAASQPSQSTEMPVATPVEFDPNNLPPWAYGLKPPNEYSGIMPEFTGIGRTPAPESVRQPYMPSGAPAENDYALQLGAQQLAPLEKAWQSFNYAFGPDSLYDPTERAKAFYDAIRRTPGLSGTPPNAIQAFMASKLKPIAVGLPGRGVDSFPMTPSYLDADPAKWNYITGRN